MQINHTWSAKEIFEKSKRMMATLGEWELIGITSEKFRFLAGDGEQYEELRFYVRKLLVTGLLPLNTVC